MDKQLQDLSSYINSNQCHVSVQILDEVQLAVEEVLFTALVKNLLINAINSTPNGHVDIFIEQKQMTIVDNGTGLDHKSRGYEGFGIGLVLVRDICHKYHWSFSLENNVQQGCVAKVAFSL
jgi:signal transduction histidine kinase